MPMLSEDDLNLAELIDDELGRGISGSTWRQATNKWTRRIRMGCLWARSLTISANGAQRRAVLHGFRKRSRGAGRSRVVTNHGVAGGVQDGSSAAFGQPTGRTGQPQRRARRASQADVRLAGRLRESTHAVVLVSSAEGRFRWNPARSWYAFASASNSISPNGRAKNVTLVGDPVSAKPLGTLIAG